MLVFFVGEGIDIYTGFIYSASGGTIQFQFNTDDGMVVFFNGVNVLQSWAGQGDTQYTSGSITLPAGYTPIVSRWYDGGGGGQSILRTNINGGGGQAASQVASAPPNVYDNDLVKTMFEGYSLT